MAYAATCTSLTARIQVQQTSNLKSIMVDSIDVSSFSSYATFEIKWHVTTFPRDVRSFEDSVNRLNRKLNVHVLLPLPINSQFLGIHETRRERNRHHGGANASMHARTHLHWRPRVRIASRCIDLMRMPTREKKREIERRVYGGHQSGRHAVQRAANDFSLRSRSVRNVLFICSLSTVLASASLGMSGLREKHPLYAIKVQR